MRSSSAANTSGSYPAIPFAASSLPMLNRERPGSIKLPGADPPSGLGGRRRLSLDMARTLSIPGAPGQAHFGAK